MEKCFEKNFNIGRYEFYKNIFENRTVLKFREDGVLMEFILTKLQCFKNNFTPYMRLKITFMKLEYFKSLGDMDIRDVKFEGYNHPGKPPEEDEHVILYDGYDEFEGRYSFGEWRIGDKQTIPNHICGWRNIK